MPWSVDSERTLQIAVLHVHFSGPVLRLGACLFLCHVKKVQNYARTVSIKEFIILKQRWSRGPSVRGQGPRTQT